jgi:hypothetical protein
MRRTALVGGVCGLLAAGMNLALVWVFDHDFNLNDTYVRSAALFGGLGVLMLLVFWAQGRGRPKV